MDDFLVRHETLSGWPSMTLQGLPILVKLRRDWGDESVMVREALIVCINGQEVAHFHDNEEASEYVRSLL